MLRLIRAAIVWTLACAAALASLPAHAQAPRPAAVRTDPRPWARGVSAREQQAALALFAMGNREFVESRFAQALVKYREAVLHWDHPAIRFNMAVCLIRLDQPIEANDNLERGMAHGAAPLGPELYSRGLTYRKLLDAQLVRVRVSCPEPEATVTLDGRVLFVGPGSAEPITLPGEHQVVATSGAPAVGVDVPRASAHRAILLACAVLRASVPHVCSRANVAFDAVAFDAVVLSSVAFDLSSLTPRASWTIPLQT